MEVKYVLCRPRGGLNDQLCSIMDCYEYAKNFGRKLIVDSTRDGIFDNFWHYFWPRHGDLIFVPVSEGIQLDCLSVFPATLSGRVTKLNGSLRPGDYFISDTQTGTPLTFDFSTDYGESVLLHEQGRVGHHPPRSADFWITIELRQKLKREILDSLSRLPKSYCALHIRHTDYETPDYESFISNIAKIWTNRDVLLCSDSELVFATASRYFDTKSLYRLSSKCSIDGLPMHTRFHGQNQWNLNVQAITDLFALSFADETFFLPVTVTINGKKIQIHSGFSVLASQLSQRSHVLNSLLGKR